MLISKNYSTWPIYSDKEILSVINVLKSRRVNYLNGNIGKLFEKKFSSKMGVNYSCAVANGTVGLEIALRSLNLKKNDEVIVTPRSYISSVSCIINAGAKPIFADIDNNLNIDFKDIEKKINKNTKAILCVHLYGYPCDMQNIRKISKQNNLFIIEDCSQAHGAMIDNKKVGSFGDISVWSFCNDKIISTGGEGGMIGCKKKSIYKLIWSLKDIGKNYDKFKRNTDNSFFPYLHDTLGTNARLTEMQSAIGLIQLRNLDTTLKKRNRNANILDKHLYNIPSIKIPERRKEIYHAYYRYVIILKFNNIKSIFSLESIIQKIRNKNIYCNVGGCPEIYNEKFFKKIKDTYPLINAKFFKNKTLSFKVDQTISSKNMLKIALSLKKIFSMISK